MNPKTSMTFRARPGKNGLACYRCRKVFPTKEGSWANWNSMQVFLCKACDVGTKAAPERKASV